MQYKIARSLIRFETEINIGLHEKIHPICAVCKQPTTMLQRGISGMFKDELIYMFDHFYIVPWTHYECYELFKLTPQLYV